MANKKRISIDPELFNELVELQGVNAGKAKHEQSEISIIEALIKREIQALKNVKKEVVKSPIVTKDGLKNTKVNKRNSTASLIASAVQKVNTLKAYLVTLDSTDQFPITSSVFKTKMGLGQRIWKDVYVSCALEKFNASIGFVYDYTLLDKERKDKNGNQQKYTVEIGYSLYVSASMRVRYKDNKAFLDTFKD